MQLNAIDLFAGCGGLSYGLQRAGFSIRLACEIDQSAADTYAQNHSDAYLLRGDVRDMERSLWSSLRGEIDLVAGGPPCQGFSVSGRRQYGEVPDQNTLVESFLEVVNLVRPRFVLIENVAGFRTAQLRPGVKALPFTLRQLEEFGYSTAACILQAADFGVPSLRSRLFILASLRPFETNPFPQPTHSAEGGLLEKHLSCLEAISDLPPLGAGEGYESMVEYPSSEQCMYQAEMRQGSEGVRNHVAMRHTPRLIERFSKIPQGGSSYRFSSGEVTVYKSNNQRLVGALPSLCITANFQSNYIHPVQHRNLTAREAARLMSYPDTFQFLGKRTLMSKKFLEKYGRPHEAGLSQYNQIGNSVPPRLAEAVGQSLQQLLTSQRVIAA